MNYIYIYNLRLIFSQLVECISLHLFSLLMLLIVSNRCCCYYYYWLVPNFSFPHHRYYYSFLQVYLIQMHVYFSYPLDYFEESYCYSHYSPLPFYCYYYRQWLMMTWLLYSTNLSLSVLGSINLTLNLSLVRGCARCSRAAPPPPLVWPSPQPQLLLLLLVSSRLVSPLAYSLASCAAIRLIAARYARAEATMMSVDVPIPV